MDSSFWQTTIPSVRDRNFYALNNSLFCDFEFSVVDSDGDKVNIPVHKYILAISSPVFQAMFYGQLAETRRVIELQDCTKEGLEELLHYVYTDEVNLTESNVMEVMLLADKYMLPFLVERCYWYLKRSLKPEDVFSVLPQVQNTANKKALYLCWDIIDSHTQRAVTSQPFLEISREMLREVLARQWLHIEEIELFHAVDRWALSQIKKKKNPKVEVEGGRKRTKLGDEVVQLIRFPVMSQKEFASYVLPSDILLKSEIVEIMQAFSGVMPRHALFKYERRVGQRRERWSEVRFSHNDDLECSIPDKYNTASFCKNTIQGGPACIDFLVNKRVSLSGVRFIGFYKGQYHIKIQIYQTNDPNSILYQSIGHESHTTGEDLINNLYPGYTVMIHRPVQLEPDVRYTIDADIRGPPYPQRGRVGKKTITCGDVIISFMNSDHGSEDANTVNNGQFPAFLLKWD